MKARRMLLSSLAVMALSILSSIAAPTQVEFTAELLEIQQDPTVGALLVMEVTPTHTLNVRITIATEIRDRQGAPIALTDLAVGDFLKIEGNFTDVGVLAREVQISDRQLDFELRGTIEQIDTTDRTMTVLGFQASVPVGAEIKDEAGNLITFSQLALGNLVKVEGMLQDNLLVAREVRRLALDQGFADIRFLGQVVEVTPTLIEVSIDGVGNVPVHIDDQTEIRGDLFVGAFVKVKGVLNPDLSVAARRISVVRPLEAVPDEVSLDFQQSHRIDLVLDQVLGVDLPLTIESQNPEIATASTELVTIPAGSLSASFEVLSGSTEGVARIDIRAPQALGGFSTQVKVEVETVGGGGNPAPNPAELTEIKWSPDKLIGLSDQAVMVTLSLTKTVDEDLTVDLFLKDGPPDLVEFPSQVVIPAGHRTVPVEVVIGSGPGRAKVRAILPPSVGSDTDDLEVEIRFKDEERIELSWVPDDFKMGTDQETSVLLKLDQPAPFDFKVAIRLKDGDPSLISGLPDEIAFEAGSTELSFVIRSGDRQGRVRFEAEAPFSLGGDKDGLKIEIEN